jgi:hypothetical protein
MALAAALNSTKNTRKQPQKLLQNGFIPDTNKAAKYTNKIKKKP